MNVILFFTYGVSLKDWYESGLLNRELKHYETLAKYFDINFTFITYGNTDDYKFINNEKISIIPIYSILNYSKSKTLRLIKSFYIPFIINNELGEGNKILKTNQLLGSWVALIYKLITKSPLIIRTGYDLYSFSKYENKIFYKRFVYYLLTYVSLIFSNYYLVTSLVDYNFLSNKFVFKKEKLKLIPNWVDVSINNNVKNRDIKKALVVGRLEKQKNIDLIIKYFIGSNYKLDIFGEGSLKEYLMKLSKDNSNIEFKGVLGHKNLMESYSNYGFYISLSSHEGNPKSTLEAMGSGCVVIVSDIINNQEIIENLKNGILFNPKKENMLNIIENLLENSELLELIRSNGMKYINKNNSIEKVTRLESEIYKQLAADYFS